MLFNQPKGYLITFTTYGAHLHGDKRGSINRKTETPDKKFIPPNPLYENLRRTQMKHKAVLLDAPMRATVQQAIEAECKHRGYGLAAVNVRTNHAHAVVITETDPAKVMHGLKAWATRKLREAGLADAGAPVWAHGGSKRWLFTADHVRGAVQYVLEGQGVDLSG